MGGFAGGEQGLRMFVDTGDVSLLPPGEKNERAGPPALLIGFTLVLIGGFGLMVSEIFDISVASTAAAGGEVAKDVLKDAAGSKLAPAAAASAGAVAGVAFLASKTKEAAMTVKEKVLPAAAFFGVLVFLTKFVQEN